MSAKTTMKNEFHLQNHWMNTNEVIEIGSIVEPSIEHPFSHNFIGQLHWVVFFFVKSLKIREEKSIVKFVQKIILDFVVSLGLSCRCFFVYCQYLAYLFVACLWNYLCI